METISRSRGEPCSSSSPSRDVGGFRALLGRSLDVLEDECPEAYHAIGRALGRAAVRVDVEGEAFVLAFDAGRHRLSPPGDTSAQVELGTDWRALDELLDGRVTLLQSVRGERLRLRGGIAVLGRFHEGLMLFLRGAVRCPSFPELREQVRSAARRTS